VPAHIGIGQTAFQLVPGLTRELSGDTSFGLRYAEQFFDVNVYYSFDNTYMQLWLNRDDVTSLVPSVIRSISGFANLNFIIDSFRIVSIAPPAVLSPGSRVGVVTFHCAYAYRYV
jgi:hypothetical protein